MSQADSDTVRTLAEQFDHRWDLYGRPNEALIPVMEYVSEETGLLGDYNEGEIFLGEGGEILQWYGRGRGLSNHNRLLHWVQEQPGIRLGVVTIRMMDRDGEIEPVQYAEIHPDSRWE